MSYILNALRKSEQERKREQQAQTLTDQIINQPDSSHSTWTLWILLLVFINIGVLAFFSHHFFEMPEKSSEQSPSIQPKKTPGINVSEPVPTVEKLNETKTHESIKKDHILSINDLITGGKPQKHDSAPAYPLTVAVQAQAQKKETGVTQKTPVSTEKTGRQEKRIPWLRELPVQFRRTVPDITITVFVYSDLPQDRFIMVSMQKIVPGQEISPGMMLNEIMENGIQVEYQDQQFKIKRD